MDGEISNFSQVAYIRRYTLVGGNEDGIKVVEVNNGNLRFLLNESKALDIMQLWHKGENVSFISKNGFHADNKDFVKRFEGGMLYTVGLDSAGDREGYETHGSFHSIPANVISCVCNEDGIEVIAEIEDTSLFGRNLKLVRKITTKYMDESISVKDSLINNGSQDENYCLLYHCNFGYPFLDENVEIYYDGKTCIPRTSISKERIDEIHKFLPPIDNQEERCYFIENENPKVEIINKKTDKKVVLSYSKETLPKMVLWQSNASNDYALGIEPTTTFLDNLFKYSTISPSERKFFSISIQFNNE